MKNFILIIIFLMLISPGVIYEFTSIHIFKSISSLRYQWLNSPLSLIYLISIPFLIIVDKYYSKRLVILVISIFLWDILFSNFFAYANNFYESYINLFFGILISLVFIKYLNYDFSRILSTLEKIIIANVVITIAGFFLGFSIDYNRFSFLRLNFPFFI